MRREKRIFSLFFLALILFYGCKKKSTPKEENKIIQITVENSLKPLMEDMIDVFNYQYPNQKLKISYKPYHLCKQDLFNPKVDLIVSFNVLTQKEKDLFFNQNKFYAETDVLAFDALVFLSNQKTPIRSINLTQISALLEKKIHQNQMLVFDGQNETAIYNFLSQEFLNGKSFSNHVEGAKNGQELVDYISKNPNKIGFINNLSLNNLPLNLKNLTIASIETNQKKIEPTKENILSAQYPLIQPIIFVLKHNYETPATWFVSFMQQEKGQLIFKQNGLIPSNMNLSIRKINYKW